MTSSERRLDIRRLAHPTAEELEKLSAFDREAFGETGLRPYDLGLLARTGAVFVAHLEGEPVAGCQLVRMMDDPRALWMVGFYVRPEWRGRGLGREFLAAVIEALPTLDATVLVLTVDITNVAALSLYRSLGFVLLEEVPEMYGRGEDRHLMRLDVRPVRER